VVIFSGKRSPQKRRNLSLATLRFQLELAVTDFSQEIFTAPYARIYYRQAVVQPRINAPEPRDRTAKNWIVTKHAGSVRALVEYGARGSALSLSGPAKDVSELAKAGDYRRPWSISYRFATEKVSP
jgi:hypothetical protein